jgi:hypothetical protein
MISLKFQNDVFLDIPEKVFEEKNLVILGRIIYDSEIIECC